MTEENVGRLRDKIGGNILGGFGLFDLLAYVRSVDIERLKDPPNLDDADDIQEWFIAVVDAVAAIPSDDPNLLKVKAGCDLLGRMIQSDLFDEAHEFVSELILQAFEDDEESVVEDGKVGGRSRNIRKELGLTRMAVARAVAGLRQDPDFVGLPSHVQREMILSRATGRTIEDLKAQVGEGRDWQGFFESFGDFLIKIQPLIELFIKLFAGGMLLV